MSSRAVAEAAWGSGDAHVQSTTTRRPRTHADGARGAPHLPLRFSAEPSPSAPWDRGLLSAFWERGSPDLPACGPRRGFASRHVRPIFINKAFKNLARGQASRGRRRKTSSGAASPGRLTRSGDIKVGQTSRRSRDVSHDDRHQAGATARSVLVSSLVLRGQAQARSTEASGKGFHISATRPRPAGQQDGGHRGAQDGVITRALSQAKTSFVRIACPSCPLSNWPPLLAPFLLDIWEEDQSLYE